MNEMPNISKDDLYDVEQLTIQIQESVYEILKGHDIKIQMSAILSGMINSLLIHSDTKQDFDTTKQLIISLLKRL